jgi:hypothetical protein
MQLKALKSPHPLTHRKVRLGRDALKLPVISNFVCIPALLKVVISVVITLVTNPETVPGIATTAVI